MLTFDMTLTFDRWTSNFTRTT